MKPTLPTLRYASFPATRLLLTLLTKWLCFWKRM